MVIVADLPRLLLFSSQKYNIDIFLAIFIYC